MRNHKQLVELISLKSWIRVSQTQQISIVNETTDSARHTRGPVWMSTYVNGAGFKESMRFKRFCYESQNQLSCCLLMNDNENQAH